MYSGMVYSGMQAKSICICAYDEIKVGLLYDNVCYVMYRITMILNYDFSRSF